MTARASQARRLVCLGGAALMAVGAAGPTLAATKPKPKPVCNLITDPKGDPAISGISVVSVPENDPNLDIVSADLGIDAKRLTIVIRVAKLSASDNSSPLGREYGLNFNAPNGDPVTVDGVLAPTGNQWARGKGTGMVDLAHSTVHVTVPLSALADPLKPGDVLTSIYAFTTGAIDNDQINMYPDDSAHTAKKFVVGTPTCVKVGA